MGNPPKQLGTQRARNLVKQPGAMNDPNINTESKHMASTEQLHISAVALFSEALVLEEEFHQILGQLDLLASPVDPKAAKVPTF